MLLDLLGTAVGVVFIAALIAFPIRWLRGRRTT